MTASATTHVPPFDRLTSLLRLERDDIGIAVMYSIAVGVVSLAAPIGVQALVSTVAFGGLLQPVLVLALLVFMALALAGVLRALQAVVVERIQRRVFARVALDLARRLPRVRTEAFDREHGPELVNRFFDVLSVQKGMAMLLLDGVGVALTTLAGMVILAFYHPVLLAFDVLLVIAIGALLFGLGRRALATSIEESKAKYGVAAWLEEMARHPAAFKTGGGPTYAAVRAEALLGVYLGARASHFSVLFKQIVGALALQVIAGSTLLGVGGWLVIRGKLTLGQLVAAELIVSLVVAGLTKVGKQLEVYYDLLTGMDKLGHLVDLPLEAADGEALPVRPGSAELKLVDVGYAYPGDEPVLRGVSLAIPRGRSVAIVGQNGAGKSTLVDLVFGIRAPTRGRITLDGVDTRDILLDSLREQVALVRGVEIFQGTIAENVKMGRASVSSEDVRQALAAVGLLDDLASLPDGLDTRISTGGPELSLGKAKRIGIARAIAGRPRLLVLDESLDGLDPEARRTIQAALFDRQAPWTLLVTTHDREALRAADDILVLDGGVVRPLRAEDHASIYG
ncbi:MAG: ABC transporter ATP-binding protein [Byssovorax sp.]